MEVALAARAGLGWQGKHTLLLARDAGSLYFLGELFVGLDLARDDPVAPHCGTCERCLDACPTRAIVAPYQLDARRCISYLTSRTRARSPRNSARRWAIASTLRRLPARLPVEQVRARGRRAGLSRRANGLDASALVDLFAWTREDSRTRLEGSAIRRIGHARWLRNIAVALGNAPTSQAVIDALRSRADDPDPVVREHVQWALRRHQ